MPYATAARSRLSSRGSRLQAKERMQQERDRGQAVDAGIEQEHR